MTWTEFAAVRSHIRVALQPVGATEQHGPHMTFETDTRIAHALARQLAAAVHPRAIVLPPFPLGISYHHLGFPGRLSISEGSLHSVFIDVARSLKRHGIRKLVFVNGHMGNMAGLGALVTRLRYEEGLEAAVMFYFNQASEEIAKHVKTPRWGHACEIETSLGLALAPDYGTCRCDSARLCQSAPLPVRWERDSLCASVPVCLPRDDRKRCARRCQAGNIRSGPSDRRHCGRARRRVSPRLPARGRRTA